MVFSRCNRPFNRASRFRSENRLTVASNSSASAPFRSALPRSTMRWRVMNFSNRMRKIRSCRPADAGRDHFSQSRAPFLAS
jgi:hypothetical protein